MADEQSSAQSSAASAQAYVDSLAAALNAASMTQGPQSTASLASLSQAAAAAATGNTLASPLLSINPRGSSTTSDVGSAAAAMLAAGTPGLITGLPAVAVPGMVPAAVPVAAVPGAAGAAAVPSVLPAVNAAVLHPGMGTVMPAAALVPPAVPAVSALSATAVTPAAPTIVPPTPAALAVLEAATALDAAESMVRAAVNQAASVAAAEEVTDAQAADAAEAAMAAAPAGTAATEAAAEPETPDSNAVLASPIGSASADALAAAMAASAQAQQQEQLQAQQVQIQQIMAQQNLQQQIANQQNLQQQIANQQFAQQQQQQAAMMAMSPPSSSASAFSDLTAAGFPAAAAAYAAQQQQQIQQQQQQLQQQQQMMAAAGMTTATALVPTGATPAQVAAGMPSVQAVSVLVPSGQNTSQAMNQMSQPLVSQMMGTGSMSGKTLGGSSAATLASQQVALSQAIAASNASMLSATPSVAGASSDATSTSSQLSNALTKLAIAQHQQQQAQQFQQQQAQQLQQQVAANAMLQAAASSASSSNLLPSIASGMSLSNLKSTSVASSVLSGIQPMSQLEPIPSTAPASGAGASGAKVRVLLSSGGEYEEVAASEGGTGGRSTRWRYVGGETRLVGLKRSHSYSGFLQQLSKATSAVWDESCRLMYDLPSGEADVSGTLVDLIDDEDLEMMWEELDVMLATKPNFRLHIYVQLGTRRSSTGQATSSIASEEPMSDHLSGSTPKSQAVAAATTAAAAVGSSSNSAAETPRHPDGQASSGSNRGAAEPAGPNADGVGGSANVTNNTNNTAVTFTSSEYDDLVEDIVSDKPQLNLSDLEAKLDIISPEDLTPVRLLGSGGFGEVYLCRWHSCEVAVKCLNPSLLVPDGGMGSISKDNVSELLKEANMLGSVRHPNIVWVYGLVLPPLDAAIEAVKQGLAPGQGIDAVKVTMQMANKHRAETPISALRPPALVTEYLASGSLRAAITRKADFVTKDSVKIKLALDAARGMEYLHGKNIVHFDLKTANLLVGMRDKTPICKVADFGLSKQKQQTYVTGVATLRGTLPWIAPEIIKTPGAVTEAVDVYSFGVVLWELWTLREPFEGINYHALLHMMSTSTEAVRPPLPGGPDFEGDAGPEPAPGWHELIRDCWMDDPSLRPSFKQLVSRLELMLRQQRMAKKRSASGPAGTGCATSTPVSQG